MKIKKLFFWIIVLSFITSCEVIEEPSNNPVPPQSSTNQTASDPVLQPSSLSPEEKLELAKKYSNQADEYYKKGQYKQALPLYEKAYPLVKQRINI